MFAKIPHSIFLSESLIYPNFEPVSEKKRNYSIY